MKYDDWLEGIKGYALVAAHLDESEETGTRMCRQSVGLNPEEA